MAIFTFRLSTLFLIIFCLCGSVSFAATINSVRTGNWNDPTTWSTGTVPTAADDVTIQLGHTVTINADAICLSLNMKENVVILATYSLTITGDATIDQSILGVNSGYVYVGGLMNVIGNGNANKGVLSVSTGTVVVVGSIYFWKDRIGTTNGSDIYRLLDISGTGTIDLGGTLVGDNGTDAATLARTAPDSYIFKGGYSTNYWDDSRNWDEGVVPGAANSAIIPLNLTANLQFNQVVKQINMAPGSLINLGAKTLTLYGNFNTNGGNLTGSGILKFDGTSVDQTYTGNFPITVANVEITKTGRNLILNGPFQVSGLLNVVGGTVSSNGYLTLLSTTSGTGSGITYSNANLGILSSTSFIIGNVNVQSVFTGDNSYVNRSYRSVSSPINDYSAPLPPKNSFSQLKDYMLVTGASAGGFDAGGFKKPYATTIKTYNETVGPTDVNQFIPITSITKQINPGVGFFVYFRGDRSASTISNKLNGTNGIYPAAETVTVTYTGQINQGQISVPVTNTYYAGDTYNGYNLVGNPYPAVIDWQKVYAASTNVDNKIYVYRPDGGFNIWSNGVPNPASASSIIQPGQGFYIFASRPAGNTTAQLTGNIVFTESSKAVTSSPMRLLSLPDEFIGGTSQTSSAHVQDNSRSVSDQLRISLKSNTGSDETVAAFDSENSERMDSKDAVHMGSSKVILCTITPDSSYLAINFLPEVKQINELKLYVYGSESGRYTLNFPELPPGKGKQILLRDEYLSKTLNIQTTPEYEFDIDATNALSYGSNRFKILFQSVKNEPAKLINFTASKSIEGAELKWDAGNTGDTEYFELEYSPDSLNFINKGRVEINSDASLNYKFIHSVKLNNVNFYRLKLISFDGTFGYSNSVALTVSNPIGGKHSDSLLSIFPNPVKEELTASLPGRNGNPVVLTIYNPQGKKMYSKVLSGQESLKQNVSTLQSGIYFLELRAANSNELIGRSKFVVGI